MGGVGSGGARTRSGPRQDPNAIRRGSAGVDVVLYLPARGRPGNAPAWPLSSPATPAERSHWTRLWKLPQAVGWELNHQHDQVALYCRRLVVAESPESPSAAGTLAKQLMDGLGLTALGLASLKWEIDLELGKVPVAEPGAKAPPKKKAATGKDLAKHLRVVKPGDKK